MGHFSVWKTFLTWFYLHSSSNSFVTCLAERQTFKTTNHTPDLKLQWAGLITSGPLYKGSLCILGSSFKTLLITYKALNAVTLLYVSDLLSPCGPARVERSSGKQPFICFRLETERTERTELLKWEPRGSVAPGLKKWNRQRGVKASQK